MTPDKSFAIIIIVTIIITTSCSIIFKHYVIVFQLQQQQITIHAVNFALISAGLGTQHECCEN